MEFLIRLVEKYGVYGLCFAFAVFGLTFLIKWGYKILTSKIKTEEYRKLANAPIVFFPIGLGIAVWFFYDFICDEYTIAEIILAGIVTGGASIIFYELIGKRIEDAILCGVKNEKIKKALQNNDEDFKEMKKTTKKVYGKAKDKLDGLTDAETKKLLSEEAKNQLDQFLEQIKKQ